MRAFTASVVKALPSLCLAGHHASGKSLLSVGLGFSRGDVDQRRSYWSRSMGTTGNADMEVVLSLRPIGIRDPSFPRPTVLSFTYSRRRP